MDVRQAVISFDFIMAMSYLLFGFSFYKSSGEAMNFLTGYNMKFNDERKKYDEKQMCKEYGKRIMCWAIPFLVGLIIDLKYVGKGVLIAWIMWAILFIYFLIMRYKTEN